MFFTTMQQKLKINFFKIIYDFLVGGNHFHDYTNGFFFNIYKNF